MALARTLVSEADIYLFDEPTANLDKNRRAAFYDLVGALRAEGKIIIVSTHDVGEIARFDGILLIERGEVVASGGHDELLAASGAYRELLHELEREGVET